ncbi:hypothetical protein ACHQM5_016905 [Ranunculus cassubicifolius]
MARDDELLADAKRGYREASSTGKCQEEARWANVIGNIHKNRGEYVEALKWLRIDYEVSIKHLPEKQILPTCQSLGEVYLRLQHFQDALKYQKEHLERAKDSEDLVEQQRAATQLGRTYHEVFLISEDDHSAVRNAKKYFKSSMQLARILKENSISNKSSDFLKEFVDAHNNLGMLEMDLDNVKEAERILLEGLKICDEEEVVEDDDGRSRLNHNLGSVYMVLRMWDKAREHIEKDIRICKRIEHRQGEAKGYINLGELHYRVQKYEEALLCYQKALKIAKTMEDEDALVENINQNIDTIKEAGKVMDELKKEEQNLKKLTRKTSMARGTGCERKCLLKQNASLDSLIEKSSMIFAWKKHLEFAKRKKRVASELCDKEKLSDSFLAIGESYQKLRRFDKGYKWYTKSWNTYKAIGNLEGQALAKINIGDVLDTDGDWMGALEAFKEGYRIAVEANMPSIQISALDNMHYSYMIRLDDVDEARRIKLKIQDLKQSTGTNHGIRKLRKECCSETETEGEDDLSDTRYSPRESPMISGSSSVRSKTGKTCEDDEPLVELFPSSKRLTKRKASQLDKPTECSKKAEISPKGSGKSNNKQYPLAGRKRSRVVFLDDDSDGDDEAEITGARICKGPTADTATSSENKHSGSSNGFQNEFQNHRVPVNLKDVGIACTPVDLEESTCSHKSGSGNIGAENGSISVGEAATASNFAASGSKTNNYVSSSKQQNKKASCSNLHISDEECSHHITFKVDDNSIRVDAHSCMFHEMLSIECVKVEVACLYYLQLPEEKRSKGLLPIIRHMKCGDRALDSMESVETLKDEILEKGWIEVTIDGWVQKRLMKLYLDCCKKLHEAPNMKLLKKLYNLEVSEDEVVLSGCDLQDISIAPLLDALREHKTIATLDLSHNLLGNETMEKLQQIFMSSSQKYGGLTLDLHCNRLGPTALFQICECPVLFARLEVLNVSGNRLTEKCGYYLSKILSSCKSLYSLNIERCSITSRTVQMIVDAIDPESILAHLCIGHNNLIAGNAIVTLLAKLTTLKSFSELNLNGLKLSTSAVNKLCELAKTSCLSGLMLGGTSIGSDGLLKLTSALAAGPQELVRLDLSFCGLSLNSSEQLFADITCMGGILELNLGGNPIGVNPVASLLANPHCSLRVLALNKCHLGLEGITKIIQALSGNDSLEELNLAENVNPEEDLGECNHLEVADSEEEGDIMKAEPISSAVENSGISSSTTHLVNQLTSELSKAIGLAKQLKVLDLSNNGLKVDITETLFTAWSSGLRASGLAQRHVKEEVVHFSVGKKCCGVQICCKKD